MFVPLERLFPSRLDRARAKELRRLRARFTAQAPRWDTDHTARALAHRILELKRALASAFSDVTACATCARGCAPPAGAFEGGRCCGTSTLTVFSPVEVRALRLAGVDAPSEPAEGGHADAGCLFRGPSGCSLSPAARPSVCAVYVCLDLGDELDRRDDAPSIAALRRELAETFSRFAALPP